MIAPNYFSQALTLGASLASEMPEVDFRIFLLQDCENTEFISRGIDKYLKPDSRALHSVDTVSNINWQDFDIARAANYYELLELATSVKPALLRHYLEQGWGRVTYLDPDIQVHADFSEILDDNSPLSLTPHIRKDFPLDASQPNQHSILTSGIFNLGFVSVRPQAKSFLDWWSEKLQSFCTVDLANGLFVDQRWMDWSVTLSNPQVIRNPGLNVAYWNLHERKVVENGTGYQVITEEGAGSLYFFHFSGFLGSSLSQLSKYSDRVFTNETISRRLLKNYASERAAWEKEIVVAFWSIAGREGGHGLPGEYRNSMLFDARVMNQANQGALLLADEKNYAAEIPLPPYEPGSCPTCGACTQSFLRRSVEKFASWLQVAREVSADIKLANAKYSAESMSYFSNAVQLSEGGIAGLKLIGCFASPTGVGQMARNVLQTLDAARFPVFAENIPTPLDSEDLLRKFELRRQPKVDYLPAVIGFVNAESWVFEVTYSNRANLKTQNVAGVWAWEIEHTPEYFHRPAKETDLIFGISPFSAKALGQDLNHPVSYLPTFGELPLVKGPQAASEDFKEFSASKGIDQKYLLARFDSKSVLLRKNPEAILDVWESIQSEFPSVQLVVKSSNLGDLAPPELLRRLKNLPRIVVIDEVISEDLNVELLRQSSAYISLHRAEGLGLNILEAVTADIPAVFTDYSGLANVLSPMGFPVKYTLKKVGPGGDPYNSEALWAEPDAQDAILQTRRALNMSLSGEWGIGQDERRAWVNELYKSSSELTVKLATELLNMPSKISLMKSQTRSSDRRLFIKKTFVLSVRRIWKKVPLGVRIKFRPFAMRTYRRFF